MQWTDFEPSQRDILIHRARIGEITPDEAETEAARQGVGPLATKPNPVDFDPSRMPDWSLPMALAWIAWRTIDAVREHCAEYREEYLLWFPGSWNVPTDDGKEFERVDGYELRSLRRSTSVRLVLVESYLRSAGNLPSTRQMTIEKAEKELFAALSAGHLVAIGKDDAGKVVDIPQREWPYLRLFEEQEDDVLKHDALDARPAFKEIKLWRSDLQRLWQEFLVQPHMIEPMMQPGAAGYVPFCAALHWIMTHGGSINRNLDDLGLWEASVQRLLPLISTGEVKLVGRPISGGPTIPIASETFAGVLVSHPLRDDFSVRVGHGPWIGCTPYIDQEHWNSDFNDKLYFVHFGPADWTHLRLRKADLLREFKFEDRREELAPVAYKTGAPGRPSSKQLVTREFDARRQRGEAAKTVTLEAIALASWLSEKHPSAPQMTAKTIENQIRAAFRSRDLRPQN
jgi:hypothetical protein